MRSTTRAAAGIALLAAVPASAQPVPPLSAILPPALPWSGASERLIVPANDPWITPAEAAGFTTTPRYAEVRA
jgi:hypothetical protein